VRRLTTGLFLSLCCLPLYAQAGTIITQTPAGVQVIIGGPDPTPRPHLKHPKKKAAASSVDAAANYHEPLAVTGDEAYGLGAVVVRNALRYVGVPYVWGGASPGGFDCSGFTWYVYRLAGISIPRTADVQFAVGRPIAGDPMPGDLVFFQTYDYGASHVGIYLGNGQFVNSIGDDVHIASFNSYYFRSRYIGARRFLPSY
jgi:cell wall-associated NlpC family hydrolase